MPEDSPEIVHEGVGWILGRDSAGYGIWARRSPGVAEDEPAARFEATPEGLTSASQLYSHWERMHAEAAMTAAPNGVGAPEASPRRRRSRWWWSIPIGVIVLAGVAAGTLISVHGSGIQATSDHVKSATATTTPPVGNGYLSSSTNAAIFVQWNQSGESVSGTAQDDWITGTPPSESLSTDTITVSGEQNGSTISLSFNGDTEEFGTISGGSFTLNFPQSDGSLAPVTFQQSSTSAFNSAVAALNASINQANQTAAEQAQLQKQQSAINGDVQTVAGDIAALNSLSFSDDLAPLPGDVTKAASDLASTEQEAQVANGEQGAENQCDDAGTSEDDAGDVQDDAGDVEDVAGNVANDVSSARGLIAKAPSDYQQLQSEQSNLPSYRANPPSLSALNQAIASAQKAIGVAIAAVNTAIGQVNADQTTSYQDYSAALGQAGNCGDPASPPTAVPTIS